MPHKDPVTPEVYEEVLSRETLLRYATLLRLFDIPFANGTIPREHEVAAASLFRLAEENPCAAPSLDQSESGRCSGRLTLDHVHHQAGGMKGKRAPSDASHLVCLCAFHHLGEGDKGGRIWASANRPLLRAYLHGIYRTAEEDDEITWTKWFS